MSIPDFKIFKRLLKSAQIFNLYHFKRVVGFSIDSRSIKKGEAFIAIKGRHKDGHNFIKKAVNNGAVLVIAEKYVLTKPRVPFFVVDDSCNALGIILNYIRKKRKLFVCAITGSVGKTTIKDIFYFLLEPYFKVLKSKGTENNLLGVAKALLSLKDEKIVILEIGTNARGEVRHLADILLPDLGIISFIKPVHLDGLGSLKGIYQEKISLFEANPKMKLILNHDDPYLSQFKPKGKIYWFGKGRDNSIFAHLIDRKDSTSIFLINDKYKLNLSSHLEIFLPNILAALAGAKIVGRGVKESVDRLNSFNNFSDMRMDFKDYGKFFVLNDTYNANPYSFEQALVVLKKYNLPKIAIIADMLELGNKSVYYHRKLALDIIKAKFDYCFFIGKFSRCTKEHLESLGHSNVFHFSLHKDIADSVEDLIKNGERKGKRYLIFIKGSRKMELEKVLNYLK